MITPNCKLGGEHIIKQPKRETAHNLIKTLAIHGINLHGLNILINCGVARYIVR